MGPRCSTLYTKDRATEGCVARNNAPLPRFCTQTERIIRTAGLPVNMKMKIVFIVDTTGLSQ